VYACFGIFLPSLPKVTSILSYPWQTKFRGNLKNSNVPGIEKTRHPRRVARTGQRPRNHDTVLAGERSGKPPVISIRQHLCHGRLRFLARAMANTLTCLVPASPAQSSV